MSHLGFGAEFGNFVMMLLLGVVAIVAIRFLMRRFAPSAAPRLATCSFAAAGAALPPRRSAAAVGTASRRRASQPAPRGRDPARRLRRTGVRAHRQDDLHPAAGRQRQRRPERPARLHDAGDVRATQARPAGARPRRPADTDVVRVDAEVLDVAPRTPTSRSSASASTALIREDAGGAGRSPSTRSGTWCKPADGSREWAIAGIQPTTPALAQAA